MGNAKSIAAAVAFATSCTMCAAIAGQTAFKVADAVVVRAKTASNGEKWEIRYAAMDLTNAIFKTTGHLAPVFDEGKEPSGAKAVIYVGPTEAAKAAGLDGRGMRKGDWRVKCEPGRAFLYSRTAYSTVDAVYEFLEKTCDFHVVNVEGDDVFTFNPDLAAKVCDVTVRPAIYQRDISTRMNNGYIYPKTKENWIRFERAHGTGYASHYGREGEYTRSRQMKGCHSSFDYLPPEKWFKTHPEYYAMGTDGKRHGVRNAQSELCYTNPDVYRLVLESLERFVAADRNKFPDDPPLVYDFSQQDNTACLCLCPECKKVIAKYDREEGGHKSGGDAGLLLEFVNRLARDIRAKYPDVQIRTFAYVSTERAPKPGTITIEPNVRIWWCDVYSHSDHTIPLRTPGHFNELQVRELDEWHALTKNIAIWDYMLYRSGFPEISPDAIKSDAEYFASKHIPVMHMESEYHDQPFYELNHYLMGKLYIDPSLDVDALIDTFCRSYGPAAKEMRAAIEHLRREIRNRPAKTPADWHQRLLPWLADPKPLRRFSDMVQLAYDKLPPGGAKSRVARILASTWRQLAYIYRKDMSAAAEYAMARGNYLKYGVETARTAYMEPTARAGFEAKVRETLDLMELKFDDLPDGLKTVPDGELVCLDYHAAYIRGTEEDPLSSRGRAVAAKDYKRMPVPCGVYDHPSKDHFRFTIKAEDLKPGSYAWVKLGKCHVGWNSSFYFPGSWHSKFMLKDIHLLSDGLETDPNWYELWASAREGDGVFLIDRLAFRRVKP